MKIAVAVKQVGELGAEFEPQADARRIASEDLEWSLNDWDRFALEAGLELRDENGGEVAVFTVGGPEAEEALLASLAQGADRGVRIWDESIEPEPLTVARVLAAAIGREAPDLILCGVQSSDAVNAATGVALAGLLDLPRVAVVRRLRYDAATGSFEVDRELEGGLVERVSLATPALLTVQTGINRPRHANLRAIKRADAKPREVLGLAALGLDAGELERSAGARVRSLRRPDATSRAEMLEGDAEQIARQILEIVSSRVGS